MSPTSKAEIKNIDHLGIVAGLIDEIGIVETINSKLRIDPREKISAGILVKAILINGLGFVSRREARRGDTPHGRLHLYIYLTNFLMIKE